MIPIAGRPGEPGGRPYHAYRALSPAQLDDIRDRGDRKRPFSCPWRRG